MPNVLTMTHNTNAQPMTAATNIAGCLDVETTGLSPHTDDVVELAIALFEYDTASGRILRTVDEYVGLQDPGRPIPPGASNVHGLTDADVAGKQLDHKRIAALLQRADFLIAHNVPFDRPFVARLFPQANDKLWLCSMRDIDWYGDGFRSRGLQQLLRAHGIPAGQAHRGGDDVRATMRLLSTSDVSGEPYFKRLLAKKPR